MLGGLSRRLHGLICVIRAISGCYAGVQCAAMSVIPDIPLALRLFRQTPTITAIALVSIALTVAATSVVYTAIKAVLIDPLPYVEPEQQRNRIWLRLALLSPASFRPLIVIGLFEQACCGIER